MAQSPLTRRKSVGAMLKEGSPEHSALGLRRNLGVRDLTLLGIAAIVGAGLFSTIGQAASDGGPAVSLLFVFTALACGFAALCYAEFASAIPIAGSAYTYAYASFGELAAWIIGWDLLVEYAVGNIAVAISWSDYTTGFLAGLGLDVPPWLSTDLLTATRAHDTILVLLNQADASLAAAKAAFLASPSLEALRALATDPTTIFPSTFEGYLAYQNAPVLFGLPLVFDLPALLIVVGVTAIVYVGIQESKAAGNWLVYIKLGVIALVLGIGAFYITPDNWSPFAPNGFGGVMKGVAAVFFAYIGFDSLSTLAEETKNPQRDLPRAMMLTLIICASLYVIISLVLTGVVPYTNLAVGDPMAEVIRYTGLPAGTRNFITGLVAAGAIVATTSVLLVFQMGQPRILMSMSRDGLLPKRYGRVHRRFRTPAYATLMTGLMVGLPVLFFNLEEVTNLTSIGTLFAFVLVCGGVLWQQRHAGPDYQPKFRVFYLNGGIWLPVLLVTGIVTIATLNAAGAARFFAFQDAGHGFGWSLAHRAPMLVFLITSGVLTYLAVRWKLSLLPCLGLLTCLYLMAEVDPMSWLRFIGWLAIGLLIYFSYGIRKSKLAGHEA